MKTYLGSFLFLFSYTHTSSAYSTKHTQAHTMVAYFHMNGETEKSKIFSVFCLKKYEKKSAYLHLCC